MSSWEYSPGAKKIDVISRIVFPATFAGLNVIYWSYYLAKADIMLEKFITTIKKIRVVWK